MKKWILLSALMGAMPLSMLAQDDDMYFVPTKQTVAQARTHYSVSPRTYYSGSNRSVDEYNRRGSYYQPIPGDSLSDVIDFSAVAGVYPTHCVCFERRRHTFDSTQIGNIPHLHSARSTTHVKGYRHTRSVVYIAANRQPCT